MVLIGIGNPYRRDDGVGPALSRRSRRPGPGCGWSPPTVSRRADRAWAGAEDADLVDAVVVAPRCSASRRGQGSVHRTVWAPGPEQATGPLAAPGRAGPGRAPPPAPHPPRRPRTRSGCPRSSAVPAPVTASWSSAVEAAPTLGFWLPAPCLSRPSPPSLPRLTRAVCAEFGPPLFELSVTVPGARAPRARTAAARFSRAVADLLGDSGSGHSMAPHGHSAAQRPQPLQ